jgi:hypothetical protein
MDIPTFKIIEVPKDIHGKNHIIKQFDRKLVLIHDSTFNDKFKEGIIFTSGDSQDTYLLFDPVTERKLTLEYKNLMEILVREQM